MSDHDEGIVAQSAWAGMFSAQTPRPDRRAAERRGTQTPAQRAAAKRRPLTKTAQINFRATPEFKALTELLASRLRLPVAETFVQAITIMARTNGITVTDDADHEHNDPEHDA